MPGLDVRRRADGHAARIDFERLAPRLAAQIRFVRALGPRFADGVALLVAVVLVLRELLVADLSDVAEDVRRERRALYGCGVRVLTHGQLDDVDAGIVLDVLEHLHARRFVDVERDDRRLERRLAQVVEARLEILHRRADHLGQLPEHPFALLDGDLPRDGDRPCGFVVDEHRAVAVQDAPARHLGLDDARGGRDCFDFEVVLGPHLEEPQARQKCAKEGDDHDADDGDPDAAVVGHGDGPAAGAKLSGFRENGPTRARVPGRPRGRPARTRRARAGRRRAPPGPPSTAPTTSTPR